MHKVLSLLFCLFFLESTWAEKPTEPSHSLPQTDTLRRTKLSHNPQASLKVLITGFEEFEETKTVGSNPSSRILPLLKTELIQYCKNHALMVLEKTQVQALQPQCNPEFDVDIQSLPVEPGALNKLCKPSDFDVVISLGFQIQGGTFTIERFARNCLQGEKIEPEAETNTLLEGPPIPESLIPKKIGPFDVILGSEKSSGDFVCNETFYHLCKNKNCRGYFIHIPWFKPNDDLKMSKQLAQLICTLIQSAFIKADG